MPLLALLLTALFMFAATVHIPPKGAGICSQAPSTLKRRLVKQERRRLLADDVNIKRIA